MSNKIKCLICGKRFKRVCRHANQSHGVTAREYKEMFGLDVSKGIMTPSDRQHMRDLALENKMDVQLRRVGAETRFPKGHSLRYQRSQETLERLKRHGRTSLPRKDRKPNVALICHQCGQPFETRPYLAKMGAKYCSRRCSTIAKNKARAAANKQNVT